MKYGLVLGSLILAGAALAVAAPNVMIANADDAVQVAQMAPTAEIEKRLSLMKEISKTRKSLRKAAKAGKVGAAQVAQAEKLAALAKEWDDKALWPKGSDSSKYKTRAKPEIWQEWDKFAGRQAKLVKAASAAAEAARSGDAKALNKQLGAMGCGGCHKPYRGPKPK